MASLEEIERNSSLVSALHEKCQDLHNALSNLMEGGFRLSGYSKGPVKHLYLVNPPEDLGKHQALLHDISQHVSFSIPLTVIQYL